MIEIFSKEKIKQVYFDLREKKRADRQKNLPVGLDGVSSEIFERNLDFSINEIYRKLLSHDGKIKYKFASLLRIERTKSVGGIRALHIPRLRDQIVFRLLHNEIQQLAEENSIDLKLKSPYSLVTRFDDYIRKIDKPVILKTDIAKFYDSIPRDRSIMLCKQIGLRQELLQLLFNWSKNMSIKHSNFNFSVGNESFIGLPQGLSISSLLAELYGKQIDDNFNDLEGYFRYVDDIVIICNNIQDAESKLEKLKLFLGELQLQVSANKTEIVEFIRGIEWLGLYHYPNGKYMHPEKLVRAVKPIHSLQKECLRQLALSSSSDEKKLFINGLIKKIDIFTSGIKNIRIKWYSLCVDNGQWKLMDKQIHGLIRSCIRLAKLNETDFPTLPSIHAKVISYKTLKKSQ
jgi:hypothetical protein